MRNAPGARQRAAAGVEEQVGTVAPVEMRSPEREVAAQRLRRRAARAGRVAPCRPCRRRGRSAASRSTEALDEPERLRDAQPRAVEQLDERAVAHRARRRPVRRLDQPLGLRRARASAAPCAAGAARRSPAAGLSAAYADQRQVAQVRADGREPPRDRRRRAPVGAHRARATLELLRRRVADRAVERRGERREVAAVGVHRPRRAAGGEEQQEALDVGIGAIAHRGGTRFGRRERTLLRARRSAAWCDHGVRYRSPSSGDCDGAARGQGRRHAREARVDAPSRLLPCGRIGTELARFRLDRDRYLVPIATARHERGCAWS